MPRSVQLRREPTCEQQVLSVQLRREQTYEQQVQLSASVLVLPSASVLVLPQALVLVLPSVLHSVLPSVLPLAPIGGATASALPSPCP